VSRPRGLCWTCYYLPGVRHRYSRRFVARSVPDDYQKRPPAPFPTPAMAGSPEKVAILCIRAQLGCHLWHPLDGAHGEALR
jgi:hypothetical protein